MQAFDKHVEEHGKPATVCPFSILSRLMLNPQHQKAKDLFAQMASAEVDEIVKYKGASLLSIIADDRSRLHRQGESAEARSGAHRASFGQVWTLLV
jgi:hypothetical protein